MAEMRLPKMNDLVIANIAKVAQFGAYCRLPEYDNIEVFLPIKEVSSGWIKNIREYIHEGQTIVCKVYFFDKARGSIDVSLKKVAPKESKDKIGAYNLEKRLDALFHQSIKFAKLEEQKAAMEAKVREEFGTYTNIVRSASAEDQQFEDSALPKKLKETIAKLIAASKKSKRYIVSYTMRLSSYNTESGISDLRSIMAAIKAKGVTVSYISAPKYHLSAEGKDYADAEAKIKGASDAAQALLKKGLFEIEKEKLKKEKEDIMASI
jgi:translation initiation factor 2 subunit 1